MNRSHRLPLGQSRLGLIVGALGSLAEQPCENGHYDRQRCFLQPDFSKDDWCWPCMAKHVINQVRAMKRSRRGASPLLPEVRIA